jgi:hypothetical protein
MRQLPPRALHCTTAGDQLGDPVPTRDLVGKTVQGGPGYTGDITIEGRILAAWFTLGTVAADAALMIDGAGLKSLVAIRTNCSTVTGGVTPPSASLSAFDARGE